MIREGKRNLFALEDETKVQETGVDLTALTSSADINGLAQDFDVEGAFVAPVRVMVWVREKATSAGAPTVTVVLQSSKDGVTWHDELTTPACKLADITVGKELLNVTVPTKANRFIRVVLKNAVASTTFTAGLIDGTVRPDLA